MLRKQDIKKHIFLWSIVKRQMDNLEISQSELARRSNLNTTVISAIKLGKIKNPSFILICKLAKGLELDLNDFKDLEESEI